LSADSVLKSAVHNKSEADVQHCGLLEPVQSMQAFRTNVTTLHSPRPVHTSSSVTCGEVPVLQQIPQYGGAARQVVRQNSTPSLLLSATPQSPRLRMTQSSRPSSSSAPRMSGCCSAGDISLRGRSLCAPLLSPRSLCGPVLSPSANRRPLIGHTVFHWESPQSIKPRLE